MFNTAVVPSELFLCGSQCARARKKAINCQIVQLPMLPSVEPKQGGSRSQAGAKKKEKKKVIKKLSSFTLIISEGG